MKRPRHLFLLLCTLAMLVYALVPILTVVAFSFNPLPFYAFPITGFTAKWYAALVADPRIGASLLASLGIAALVALLATLLGTLFAFFVVRAQTRFKRLWVAFGFFPLVVPVLVLAAGLQVAFVELGLPLGYPTVIIGHTLYTAPFVALMVMAQLLRYDDRLDEAARDLGASQRQMLRHVTLPILWPSIRSGLLLAFLLSFNEWAIAFFTGRGFNTLPMLIYSMARNGLPPSVLAYSTLAIACVLLVAGMILPFALKLIRGRA